MTNTDDENRLEGINIALDEQNADQVAQAPKTVSAVLDGLGLSIDDVAEQPYEMVAQLLHRIRDAGAEVDRLEDLWATERQRWQATIEDELERVDAWLEDRASGPRRVLLQATDALETWAIADRRTHIDKPQKWDVPAGSVSTTVRKPAIVVADAQVFLAWYLKTAGIEVPEDPIVGFTSKVLVSGIRKDSRFTMVNDAVWFDGEKVPGLGIAEETVTASISLND